LTIVRVFAKSHPMSRPISSESVYQALSHTTRRRVLELLKRNDHNASALAAEFSHTRATLSEHLRILQHAGLIVQRRNGRSRVYSLKHRALVPAAVWMNSLVARVKSAN
jgi:DNA-binding transcriptional ArsR family regulator